MAYIDVSYKLQFLVIQGRQQKFKKNESVMPNIVFLLIFLTERRKWTVDTSSNEVA